MTEPMLSVKDLTVTYSTSGGPVPAVRGVSFDIPAGSSLGLAGESGCGKSTLANALLRLLPAGTEVTGEVMMGGKDVLGLNPGGLRAVRWTTGAIVFQGALHAQPVIDQAQVRGVTAEVQARRELDPDSACSFHHANQVRASGALIRPSAAAVHEVRDRERLPLRAQHEGVIDITLA